MQVYGSYENMFTMLEDHGWLAEKNAHGITYSLYESIGNGEMVLWTGADGLAFVSLDVMFYQDNIMVNFSENIGVQITFIEENNMEYYKTEDNIENTQYGTFFYINNAPVPWFKKYPKNSRVKAFTLLVGDDFLKTNGICLSLEEWNQLARAINGRGVSVPQIVTVLKQIRYGNIHEDLFATYLKAKAMEAFLLLWNAGKSQGESWRRLSSKSQIAVKECIRIVSKNFVSPPLIDELAKQVGVNKKTLQFSFEEIVGLSIHKYIRTLKMQKALSLLKESDLSVESIAKEVGYNSKIHFYRAFEAVFAMKPSEMRRLL